MKIGLISDIHGNLKAFQDVLTVLKPKVEKIICLGDIVDGEKFDDECIALIMDEVIECIIGNHDMWLIKLEKYRLSKRSREFLEGLKSEMWIEGIFCTHENPSQRAHEGKGEWYRRGTYIYNHDLAKLVFEEAEIFRQYPTAIVATGHTHVPFAFSPEANFIMPKEKVILSPDKPWLINPGGIGYSRLSHLATAAIFETKSREFEVVGVETTFIDGFIG